MTVSSSIAADGGAPVPDRMRAALPGPSGEHAVVEVPVPEPVGAEVLVRVVAAGMAPDDATAGHGEEPVVAGHDFSGVVVAVPYEGFTLQPGDPVFGVSGHPRSGGVFAEYAVVPPGNLARKPARLGHPEAASVPSAGLTAWAVAVELVRAHEGQRVLIHAGSGVAGRLAVQLAAYFGARVTATGPGADLDWLRRLGADRALDAGAGFEEQVGEVDAVIDLVGDDHLHTGPRSVGVLRHGGVLVTVPGWPALHDDAERAGIRATRYCVTPDANVLAVLARLLDAGDLGVPATEVLPLARIAEAQRLVMAGDRPGRVVLQVA